jgi:polyisoprenoid-binding protein YceI
MFPSFWIASIAATVMAALPQGGRAVLLVADAGSGSVIVHAAKAGVLSAFAHDRRLVAGRWRAEINNAAEGSGAFDVVVVVDAESPHESTTRLGDSARATVDREVASVDVLDPKAYPEIRFHGTGFFPISGNSEEQDGLVRGDLTLHGSTRRLLIRFLIEPTGGGY